LNAALNRDPIPNHNIVFDENMRTNIAVGSDSCSRKHNHILPDPSTIADSIRSNICKFVNDRAHLTFLIQILSDCFAIRQLVRQHKAHRLSQFGATAS
jgi:hypothetical protein